MPACGFACPARLAGWTATMAPFLKLPMRHRSRPEDLPGVIGAARLDRRTKNLTKRLRMGDIAIIDHVDLDRLAAEALLRQQVAAVVNVAPSISGRYPNLGPAAARRGRGPAGRRRRPGRVHQGQRGRPGPVARRHACTSARRSWPRARVQTAETVAEAMTEAKDGHRRPARRTSRPTRWST